ncbi:MAG: S-layer homology domain-containing protein [Clostridia bacterium]|nr:S-layer homology domain-containing protein [Clostridia bacterium]
MARKVVSMVSAFLLFAFLLLGWMTPASAAGPGLPVEVGFQDTTAHWAKAYIYDLASYGAISGFADNTFRPEANVTRAQFAKMLVAATQAVREAASYRGKDPLFAPIALDAASATFADVRGSSMDWARPYIGGAVKAGVIKGYSDGRFGPNDCITRAQLAAMIGRLLPDSAAKPVSFPDVPSWCRSEVAKAVGVGAVSGFADGTFKPDQHATRAQVAKVIDGLLNGMDVAPTVAEVHFIDVGEADAIFARLPGGRTMMVDAGNNEDGAFLVDYLRKAGVERIDAFIATHPHEDHIGGAGEVVKNFQVARAYLPDVTHSSASYQEFLNALMSRSVPVTKAASGVTVFDAPGLSVRLLAPCGTAYEDINNYSAVAKVQVRETAFLLAGDAEDVSENEMLASGADLSAAVLKVGHHGSESPTTPAFLAAVRPKYAVISVGAGNSYGHPAAEALARLSAAGAKVFRTDRDGTVVFTTGGRWISVAKLLAGNPDRPVTGPPGGTEPAPSEVKITGKDLAAEVVTVTNKGSTAVNLQGWKLVSEAGNQTYIFPAVTLQPGASVRVWSGPNAKDSPPTDLKWTTANIWNKSGDPAALYDAAGRLVDRVP